MAVVGNVAVWTGTVIRQAVVVIHGIGEQRPMDTLRSFARGILMQGDRSATPYWSKPDTISETTELRRLQARPAVVSIPTDFYEFYWAHLMEGTRWSHLASWMRTLLMRRPSHVPPRLLMLWTLSWGLVFLALGWSLLKWYETGRWIPQISLTSGALPTVGSTVLLVVVNLFALNYIGDAARYLSASPGNIGVRHAIRGAGLAVLRRLHEDGRYGRIILVGHSLGSVIAYDLLTYYWTDVHARHSHTTSASQEAFARLEQDSTNADEFRQRQRALWKEQRSASNPWLVTDLVTLGSPLTHAVLLLAHSPQDLAARQQDRELPTCPPVADEKSGYGFRCEFDAEPGKRCALRLLHHAAPFACTRWTNLYFPGDLVGGPLAPVFGSGIVDVPLGASGVGNWLRYTPFSHTHYWDRRETDAVETVRDALALDIV